MQRVMVVVQRMARDVHRSSWSQGALSFHNLTLAVAAGRALMNEGTLLGTNTHQLAASGTIVAADCEDVVSRPTITRLCGIGAVNGIACIVVGMAEQEAPMLAFASGSPGGGEKLSRPPHWSSNAGGAGSRSTIGRVWNAASSPAAVCRNKWSG
jgi:hypothetical protein